ncbi:CxxH/CxxC protein [Alkalihalobacillus trypoxylicola]|uniref:CxxH/CxxC protein n=1 Tax=Alkalihalobacillus trypoxylicola TaxID=519424 RepID=UPI000A59D21C
MMKHIACSEHVELAMEMIIDEEETAPNIEILTNQHDLSTDCEFCQNPAKYIVSVEN